MSDGLYLTLQRTNANSADGYTGFQVSVGYQQWNIELQELAQLFDAYVLQDLLQMRIGEEKDIALHATIAKRVDETP